ncbi:unnamed protein product [Heligmosomoides polygyrus]|uniref:Reverse transcriptase domain-containing protein n=1 Tax=Heligmosomoides polygyrus TaxID=6339 RepID=A0A183GCH8_HELPZ|nr:unnamed protein product [Heligmosomoides polygyrus]
MVNPLLVALYIVVRTRLRTTMYNVHKQLIWLSPTTWLSVAPSSRRGRARRTYASGGRRTEVDHILVRRPDLKIVRDVKVLPGEEVASQHRPLIADLNIPLPSKPKVRAEPRIRWWRLRSSEHNELRRAVLEAGLPDPTGPVKEIWRRVTQTILRCAKETLGETNGGTRGDKAAWFWNEEVQAAVREKKEAYRQWQKTRAPEHLTAYRKLKRLAKTAIAKAKSAEMDALHEKLDEPQKEKFAIRLGKARHRACVDIRVVKTVKSADGRVLRKPVEVRERWEEYLKELLNEDFPRREVQEEQPTEGPIPSWTQEEVRSAIGKMKLGKAAGLDGVPVEAWKVLGNCGVN